MSKNDEKARPHRALVLQGGGALGAYEAGVLKVLCKKLTEEDAERENESRLLFDIVAGTSIGAMNGAILVSQFLKTQSWERAAKRLEKFWTEQLSLKYLDISELSKTWHDEWIKRTPTAASEEAARRYYSVKKLLLNQARNNMYYQCTPFIKDDRFFDNLQIDKDDPNRLNCVNNDWFLHSIKPLQESIEKYAKFPIATTFLDKQPRLLVFAVDVAEGTTVTFDSYPKSDGSRKSEYGEFIEGLERHENVINYDDGIGIKHVIASGTLSVFYDYASISMRAAAERKNQDEKCLIDKSDKKNTRYFWDGGLLSNTPLRELLQAHLEYWRDIEKRDKIPDLDIYIINVHPSKMDINTIPEDHDGVQDRNNDIIFGDRTSIYDEKVAHLITDYANFVNQIKELADEAISKLNDKNEKEELNTKLNSILETKIVNKERKNKTRKYKDLMKDDFKLIDVTRIERTNYINSIHGKIGDLTFETIAKLIKEGECDAWFSLIKKDINNIKLADTDDSVIRDRLVDKLNDAMKNLRKNDYEDNDSQTYYMLNELVEEVKNGDKLEVHRSAKIIRSVDAFRTILCST